MTHGRRATAKTSRFEVAVRPLLLVNLEFPLESRDGSPLSACRVEARLRGTSVPLFFFRCKDAIRDWADDVRAARQSARILALRNEISGLWWHAVFNTLFPNRYIGRHRSSRATINQRLLSHDCDSLAGPGKSASCRGYCFPGRSTSIQTLSRRTLPLRLHRQNLQGSAASVS